MINQLQTTAGEGSSRDRSEGRTYHRGWVFGAACTGMLLFGMAFLSLGTISTFIQSHFGLSAVEAASLASSLPFGMLAGSVIFGPVADRFGYKVLLAGATLVLLVSLEAIAFAPSLLALQLSFFGLGLGGGTLNGATNALAADVTTDSKGAGLSLLGVFFGLGALGMPALIGWLTRIWDYRTIVASIGFFLVLPLVGFLLLRFPEPKQRQGFPLREGLVLLRHPLLLLLGAILFFESGVEGMVSNWTTTFLGSRDIAVEKALMALSLQIAALVVTRLLLSRLLKRLPAARVLYFGLALIITASLILFYAHSFTVVAVAMVLFGAGFAAGFPVVLGFVAERYPTLSGTAFSIVIIMALIGNTLLNYFTGTLSQYAGIGYFPLLLAGSALTMVILLRVVTRKMKQQ